MNVADAAAGATSPIAGALAPGVEQVSLNQEVEFTLYARTVLPLDGFVFWVRADLLAPSAIPGASPVGSAALGTGPAVATPAKTIRARGSLHYATDLQQGEESSIAVSRVVFTSETEVKDLTTPPPGTMWLATFESLRFSFSRLGSRYQQSGLYHYQGDAVYPDLAAQIVDFPEQLDLSSPVVSNSLPFWLALPAPAPVFPSFLVPQNEPAPWIAVHIGDGDTAALQPVAWRDPNTGSSYQLVKDKVRVTFAGLRADAAQDWLASALDAMSDGDAPVGLMNSPVIRDVKRPQPELGALGARKVVEIEVSYYQTRMRQVALRHITSAFINVIIQE